MNVEINDLEKTTVDCIADDPVVKKLKVVFFLVTKNIVKENFFLVNLIDTDRF